MSTKALQAAVTTVRPPAKGKPRSVDLLDESNADTLARIGVTRERLLKELARIACSTNGYLATDGELAGGKAPELVFGLTLEEVKKLSQDDPMALLKRHEMLIKQAKKHEVTTFFKLEAASRLLNYGWGSPAPKKDTPSSIAGEMQKGDVHLHFNNVEEFTKMVRNAQAVQPTEVQPGRRGRKPSK